MTETQGLSPGGSWSSRTNSDTGQADKSDGAQ